MANENYPYDVAISYASEDRGNADALAKSLRLRGVRVFYDQYEKSNLWGKNLYTHLSDVYQNQARFCVLFLSKQYAAKLWTTREREAAQARALNESNEYILPIRLDDTDIPGILPTIAYLDWRQEAVESIATFICEKLGIKVPLAKEKLLKIFVLGPLGSGQADISRLIMNIAVQRDWLASHFSDYPVLAKMYLLENKDYHLLRRNINEHQLDRVTSLTVQMNYRASHQLNYSSVH